MGIIVLFGCQATSSLCCTWIGERDNLMDCSGRLDFLCFHAYGIVFRAISGHGCRMKNVMISLRFIMNAMHRGPNMALHRPLLACTNTEKGRILCRSLNDMYFFKFQIFLYAKLNSNLILVLISYYLEHPERGDKISAGFTLIVLRLLILLLVKRQRYHLKCSLSHLQKFLVVLTVYVWYTFLLFLVTITIRYY